MDLICKESGFKHGLLRLLLELEYNSEIHNVIIVNGMLHDFHYYEDWDYFMNK